MDQQNNLSKPVDQGRPATEDLQPSILKELKSINGKMGFFVVILILAIIIQFLSAMLSF